MTLVSEIAGCLGAGIGSLMLPYPIVLAVIKWRRRRDLVIDTRRAIVWFIVAVALMAVFHAFARAFEASGPISEVLLSTLLPIVVSWFAVMLAGQPLAPSGLQMTVAEELQAIRPK